VTLVDKYLGIEQPKLHAPIRIAGGVIPKSLICLLPGNIQVAMKKIFVDTLPSRSRISGF
jgi:hypothetical protein